MLCGNYILSNRSEWTFYFLSSVQFNFTISENIIFTENNEIAYICSTNSKTCPQFIQSVLLDIFSSFESIFFEADDTDWAAMDLLHQFDVDVTQSFNTYILDTSVTRNKLDNDL